MNYVFRVHWTNCRYEERVSEEIYDEYEADKFADARMLAGNNEIYVEVFEKESGKCQ